MIVLHLFINIGRGLKAWVVGHLSWCINNFVLILLYLSLTNWNPKCEVDLKYYPIKYSLQWFLLKPPHGGFGIFSHWYLYRNRYTCVEFENVMKSATKKNTTLPICNKLNNLLNIYFLSAMGPFINDVMPNWTFFNPPSPLCHTLSQKGRPPWKKMSQIYNLPPPQPDEKSFFLTKCGLGLKNCNLHIL